jgi:MFS transporter, ACS family, tartrate transporter
MIPASAGALGLLLNSWSSDRSGEHKWHTVIPIFCGGCCYLAVNALSGHFGFVVLLFTLYYFFSTAAFASLWAMPTTFLSKTTAAAAFGLINCIGQTGGFFGPSIVGYLNDTTGSIHRSVVFLASSLLASAVTLSFLRSTSPIRNDRTAPQDIAFEANINSQS